MDPVEQIFLQGKIGQASDGPSPFFEAYKAGVETSLAKRRLEQQDRQLAMQEEEQATMLPLKADFQRQANQLESISLAQKWQTQQALVEGTKGATELFGTIQEVARNGGEVSEAEGAYADWLGKNPLLAQSPIAKAADGLIGNLRKAREFEATLDERDQYHQELNDTRLKISENRLESLKNRMTSQGVKSQYFDKLESMRADAMAETDPAKRNRMLKSAQDFERMVIPNRDRFGKIPSKPSYVSINSSRMMREFEANPNDLMIKGKSIMEQKKIANQVAEREYDSFVKVIEAPEPTAQPPAPAAPQTSAPAQSQPQVVAQWKPGVGLVGPDGKPLSVPSVPASTQVQAVVVEPVAAEPAPDVAILTEAEVPLITQYLQSQKWSAEDIESFLNNAVQNPTGPMAAQLQAIRKRIKR